jgi:hypothetical protein
MSFSNSKGKDSLKGFNKNKSKRLVIKPDKYSKNSIKLYKQNIE